MRMVYRVGKSADSNRAKAPQTKDKMKDSTAQTLAEAAATFAMRGADEYLRRHNLTADPAALATCARSWVKLKLPEALQDAKDALACNMGQVAEQLFSATMMQAGIEAAKECGTPAPVTLAV